MSEYLDQVTKLYGDIRLSPDQQQALDELLEFDTNDSPAHALSGPAGSGKTTLVAKYVQRSSRIVRPTATTNKAARVAADMHGAEPETIHRLLGLKPHDDTARGRTILKRVRQPDVPVGSMVIIDEASMVDSELLGVLTEYAQDYRFKVLFVGDAYQLPPVFEGESPVFAGVPTSHLTTVHRQALDNPVLAVANGFRQVLDGGAMPVIESRGTTVRHLDEDEFLSRMLAAFDGEGVRAMAWTNQRVRELNGMIRRHLLGPAADEMAHLPGERFIVNSAITDEDGVLIPTEGEVLVLDSASITLSAGEYEVAAEQVYVLYDGKTHQLHVPTDWDTAKRAMGTAASEARALQKRFNDGEKELDFERRAAWRRFFALKNAMHDLRPTHASTVHKSQGSTYEHVFIDVGDIGRCTRTDIIARLMYVGISRAAQTATLTGELPIRLYEASQ
jgi:exodeoxyribonuclease-5